MVKSKKNIESGGTERYNDYGFNVRYNDCSIGKKSSKFLTSLNILVFLDDMKKDNDIIHSV